MFKAVLRGLSGPSMWKKSALTSLPAGRPRCERRGCWESTRTEGAAQNRPQTGGFTASHVRDRNARLAMGTVPSRAKNATTTTTGTLL